MQTPPVSASDYNLLQARAMSEDKLLANVIGAMRDLGWRVAHFRPAKTAKGWRTAVQGDGKGFPDVIACRRERMIVAELKSHRGSTTGDQDIWLSVFAKAGAEAYVWKPIHWLDGTIHRALGEDE